MVESSKRILPRHEQNFQVRQPHWNQTYGPVSLVCDDCHLPTNHTSRCKRAKQKKSQIASRSQKTKTQLRSLVEMWRAKSSEHEDSEDSEATQDPVDDHSMPVTSAAPASASSVEPSVPSSVPTLDAQEDVTDLDTFDEDDPGGHIEKEPLLAGAGPFINAVFKYNFPRLPTIYAAQVVLKDVNWKIETGTFSSLVRFPNAEELNGDPSWKSYSLDASAWALSKCQLHVLDFEGFYGDQLCSNFPYCKCQETLPKSSRKKMRRNGLVKGFRLTREINVRQRVLMYYSYRCDGCTMAKSGKSSRVVSGISSEIIAQLPDRVRDQLILLRLIPTLSTWSMGQQINSLFVWQSHHYDCNEVTLRTIHASSVKTAFSSFKFRL